MTRREYAISLGLAVPGRGRLSAKAHDAINKAEREGMVFSDSAFVPKPAPANPLPKVIRYFDDLPANPTPTFQETVSFKGSLGGKTVIVDGRQVCSGENGCGYSLWYCRCTDSNRSTLTKYGRVNVEPVYN